jgi:hypothetical protein
MGKLTIDPRAESVKPAGYQPRTPLGRKLWELRQEALLEGEVLTTWDEVEQEVAERRGGVRTEP